MRGTILSSSGASDPYPDLLDFMVVHADTSLGYRGYPYLGEHKEVLMGPDHYYGGEFDDLDVFGGL